MGRVAATHFHLVPKDGCSYTSAPPVALAECTETNSPLFSLKHNNYGPYKINGTEVNGITYFIMKEDEKKLIKKSVSRPLFRTHNSTGSIILAFVRNLLAMKVFGYADALIQVYQFTFRM